MMDARVIVMAKAPVPGYAKTRLISALGAVGAARLAARLLAHALAAARAAAPARLELRCAPDRAHPAFEPWVAEYGLCCENQGDGDLGARMTRAFLSSAGPTLMIGSDAPDLDAAVLEAAAAALVTADAVFVPALDGGYALVGLARPDPATCRALFEGMAWSTPEVMAATRERARAARLSCIELPALRDIDEPADLASLPAAWLDELPDELPDELCVPARRQAHEKTGAVA